MATKRITFSADDGDVGAARERAYRSGTTLNNEARRWLASYATQGRVDRAMETIRDLQSHASTGGRKFTREEMNERR